MFMHITLPVILKVLNLLQIAKLVTNNVDNDHAC